jgi:hypothetical protein
MTTQPEQVMLLEAIRHTILLALETYKLEWNSSCVTTPGLFTWRLLFLLLPQPLLLRLLLLLVAAACSRGPVVVDWEGSPRVEAWVAVELVAVLLQPQLLLVPQRSLP